LLGVAVFAQQKGSFVDARDKKTYKTVKIGTQTWMAENLNYHGEDGFLGLCSGDEPNKKIKKPENCKKYGRMYSWEEAIAACPENWHLPNDKEWQTLVDFAGGDTIAGKKLKTKSGWKEYDFSGKSPKAPKCKYKEEIIDDRGRITVIEHDKCTTDEYGFSVLPGGGGNSGGYFYGVGDIGSWWSYTVGASGSAYYRGMGYNSENVGGGYVNKTYYLFSVRCIQNEATVAFAPAEPINDSRDGKTYKTVKIGEQTWMAENLNVKTSNSVCYENKKENCDKCGRLYGLSDKKICPQGWHLPTCDEGKKLMVAGGAAAFKSKDGWDNNSGNGYDIYGFSAKACGSYIYHNYDPTSFGYGSSATFMVQDNTEEGDGCDGSFFFAKTELYGSEWHSIRCVKD
jgi:uncharacterized protein (TIGR02145 family)